MTGTFPGGVSLPLLVYVIAPPIGFGLALRHAANLLRDHHSEHPDSRYPRKSDSWPPR